MLLILQLVSNHKLQVWNLTLTMLSDKHLKAKAAETHGLLGFVVEMLVKHEHTISHANPGGNSTPLFDLLLRAGKAALDFDAELSKYGRLVDAGTCQRLFDHYNRFICLCARAELPLLPKAHLMYHLLQRALIRGNPRVYATYIDESYNGTIAQVCRSCHRRGWALAVYRKVEMMQSMADARTPEN